jgi:hypothetical protein
MVIGGANFAVKREMWKNRAKQSNSKKNGQRPAAVLSLGQEYNGRELEENGGRGRLD